MQYPAGWEDNDDPTTDLSVSGWWRKNLYIYESDMEWAQCANLSECADAFIHDLPTADPFIGNTREQIVTEQRLTVEIWENTEDEYAYYRTLFYLNENNILFVTVYETDKGEKSAELARQSHSAFRVKDK